MSELADPQAPLRHFQKTQEFFVGIDSDGCAFDTMEVKHKECFIPNIVRFFRLAAVSKYAREAAEFLNLYSHWRGTNRFPGLVMTLDLLAERPEVRRRGFVVPRLVGLRRWIERETRLSNSILRREVEATNDPDLAIAYEWSEAVNRVIGEVVSEVPPFPFVRESLSALAGKADVMVVSATPGEALHREWEEHGLKSQVALIAGQELGSKKEHLELATAGRYEKNHVLMVGDAPGDRKAMARGQRRALLPDRPGPGRRVVGALPQRSPAPVLRRHLLGRVHGRAGRPVRGTASRKTAVANGVRPRHNGTTLLSFPRTAWECFPRRSAS